ncbi:MAG: transcription termination factor NusA [Bacteriovoracaceae bacterium]|nr:transcription termination factor NusA [Bacteriovoracaceae bacterium]
MNFTEIGRLIEQLGKDRGIKKEFIVGAIEQAFVVAARKKYGIQGSFEAKYNPEEGEIEIYQYKNVVNDVRDPIMEINFEQAQKMDEDCEIGDQLGIKLEEGQFTRVDIQTAKQIIFQKVRDAERDVLFSEFKHREGEIITGIARRFERGNVMVDLGKAEAILPRREIIYGESFKPGDRIQAYLSEVVMTSRGPEIRLSRTSPMFLVKLFEAEVPEIADGTIEIKSAAREPGQRAKIAVYTTDRDVDPVGACVGMKGSRVQNIVNELQGEKIDIVRWNEETEVFVKSALAPAEITSIMVDHDEHSMAVVVEDAQLSLAIGRRGQNVRLAAMLSGWKINIISKTKLQEKIKKSVENLLQLTKLNSSNAQVLVHGGVMSVGDLSQASTEKIAKTLAIPQAEALELITFAKEALEKGEVKSEVEEGEEIVSASALPDNNGFKNMDKRSESDDKNKISEMEQRLREELAAFKLK